MSPCLFMIPSTDSLWAVVLLVWKPSDCKPLAKRSCAVLDEFFDRLSGFHSYLWKLNLILRTYSECFSVWWVPECRIARCCARIVNKVEMWQPLAMRSLWIKRRIEVIISGFWLPFGCLSNALASANGLLDTIVQSFWDSEPFYGLASIGIELLFWNACLLFNNRHSGIRDDLGIVLYRCENRIPEPRSCKHKPKNLRP